MPRSHDIGFLSLGSLKYLLLTHTEPTIIIHYVLRSVHDERTSRLDLFIKNKGRQTH